VTNGALLRQIAAAFGANPRQHPELHPATADGGLLFDAFQPGSANVVAPERTTVLPALSGTADVAALLRAIADVLAR